MCEITRDLKYRSGVVYQGLMEAIDKESAMKATRIWLNEFSDKPLYAVRPFIDRIYSNLELEIPRADLQRNLLGAMMSAGENKAETNPKVFDDDIDRIVKLSKTKLVQTKHKGFMVLIDEIFERIKVLDAEAELTIKVYLFDHLHSIGVKGSLASNVKEWLSEKRKDVNLGDLTQKQMRKVFHIIYVAACEYFGPVEADKMVSSIILELEESSQLDGFDVKEIL